MAFLSQEIVMCVILMLYTEFPSPTMTGTHQKFVCGWVVVGVVTYTYNSVQLSSS